MGKPCRLRVKPNQGLKGFALVSSLLILTLLVGLVVILLGFMRIETRSSYSMQLTAEARQNALAGLHVAIGELQGKLGPDQRITARAVSMVNHPDLSPTTLAPDSARAWWVGASSSSSDPADMLNYDPVDPLAGVPVLPPTWLVSGLDDTRTPEVQITDADPFIDEEIVLYRANKLDARPLSDPNHITGGEPITAGAVPIRDKNGNRSGSYAYFIDDNGMKAQLTPRHSDLQNTNTDPDRVGGIVIPGSFDLSILDGMSDFDGVPVTDYLKLNSMDELPLIGGAADIVASKKMSYTTRSLGVLADVKHGGLKKDLTIAFENYYIDENAASHPDGGNYPNWPVYPVFEQVFEKTSDSAWDKYLVLDESKWIEFGANGYIHWAIFRDYYNLKRFIKRDTGLNEDGTSESMDYLDPILFQGPVSYTGGLKPYAKGILAPHDIGAGSSDPSLQSGGFLENMPYGDFRTLPNKDLPFDKEFMQYYKHSPVSLILTRIQTNAWVDQGVIDSGYRNEADLTNVVDALRTRTQTFSTHYNPYNVTLRCYGNNNNLRLTGEPPLARLAFDAGAIPFAPYDNAFRFSGLAITDEPPYVIINANAGGRENRRYSAPGDLMIGPGRSRIAGFKDDFQSNQARWNKVFSLNIADNLDKSIYIDYNLTDPLPTSFDLTARFGAAQSMGHGIEATHDQKDSQWMWVPFAQDTSATGSNEIEVDAPGSGLGPNSSRTGVALELRTTMDVNDSLRALIDANIRGFYFNPRWDSPLLEDAPLDTSAAYKVTKLEELSDSQAPQMDFVSDENGDLVGGLGYWGASHDPSGHSRVILFDIPRKDLVSLGQLQHANAGRFSYEPSYIVGNSYANPRIPLDNWETTFNDTFSPSRGITATNGPITLYDASYLVNETLWDSYIFTTIPQVNDNYRDPDDPDPSPDPVTNDNLFTQLLARDAFLPNPRFIPYEPPGSSFDRDTLQRVGDNTDLSAFFYNAGHLLVDGAFNVNSTSVDAWEAFLSGTYGMPYQKLDDTGKLVVGYEALNDAIRYPRVETVFGESFETGNPTDEGYWTGFRALDSDEIRALAVEIVNQVIARGPFLSLGDFVNRKLENGVHGEKGALQAALDDTVNDGVLADYEEQATHPSLPAGENQAAGFPGQLLQGDILQALSPFMTVRSDTFTIRAYGETLNPANGESLARVWCEAVVQRYPDPVELDAGKSYLENLAEPSGSFGRQFKIISFRWLNESEI